LPLGLKTVICAVPAVATSEAEMLAVSWELLMKAVGRVLPFHSTTDEDTNPVPSTVSVKSALPGAILAGCNGWLRNGTCAADELMSKPSVKTNRMRIGVWRLSDRFSTDSFW